MEHRARGKPPEGLLNPHGGRRRPLALEIGFSAVKRRLGFYTRRAVAGPRPRAAVSRAEPLVRDVRHAAAPAAAAAAAGRRPALAGCRLDFFLYLRDLHSRARGGSRPLCRLPRRSGARGVPGPIGPIVNGLAMWQLGDLCDCFVLCDNNNRRRGRDGMLLIRPPWWVYAVGTQMRGISLFPLVP